MRWIRYLLGVPQSVARESFLVGKPLLLHVLRLLIALIRGYRPLFPFAVEAVVPCEDLLLLLYFRIGAALAVLQFLNQLIIFLDLNPVLLVVRVKHFDNGLL